MKSLPAESQPSSPNPPSSSTGRLTAVVPAESPLAANDHAAAPPANDLRNPLWIIAIGMACFFAASAVVMAVLH